MTNKDIRNFIISWDSRFPIDRWWRKKYNIAFNSHSHRESSFIDQLIEYEEDILFREIESEEKYIPGVGDWLKSQDIKDLDSINGLREEFKDID
jgi:hypothetical protein